MLLLQAETTLINFTVTEGGLEDQLLALVVNKEREDLEEAKSQLIVQVRYVQAELRCWTGGIAWQRCWRWLVSLLPHCQRPLPFLLA